MNESQQLRESMWDLVYGLLSTEESEALIVRIKSDPEAARLYSEVRLQADLVGQAAIVEDSSVVVTLDGAVKPVPAKRSAAVGRSSASNTKWVDSHRGGAWLAGIAMTALAALLMVGFFWPQPNVQQLAANFVSTDVMGPQALPAGLTSQFAVRTSRATHGDELAEGTPAALELRLMDRAGKEQFRTTVETNDLGQAQVEIPGAAIEPGIRLEVAAAKSKSAETDEASSAKKMKEQASFTAELPVQAEPQLAYFLLAEPKLGAEKQVPYSLWSFSAFSAKPASAETVQAALETVEGLVRGEPQATARDGQVNGNLQFAAGEKAAARSFAFGARKDSDAIAKEAKGRTEIAAGQPITIAVPPQLADKPVDVVAICRGVTVATSSASVGKAQSEGAQNKGAQSSGGQVSLALPPEADGLIEVQWFDRSTNETEPVERDVVYRQPSRIIQIEFPELQDGFAPGQEVALTLRCTDENGKPVPDTRLGIRVWNERTIQESGEQPVLLADAVRGVAVEALGEVGAETRRVQLAQRGLVEAERLSNRSELATADDKRLSDNALPAAAASATIGEPIELASNRAQMKAEILTVYARAESDRHRAIQVIGAAAMFGGIGVLVLMGILVLLKMSVGLRTMTPALVTAFVSLFVGLAWTGWPPRSQPFKGQIAMAPAAMQESRQAAEAMKPASDAEGAAAPALPAMVVNEPQGGALRLSDEVPATAAPTAATPKSETPATDTLKQKKVKANQSSVPSAASQEASNLRILDLQRAQQNLEVAIQREKQLADMLTKNAASAKQSSVPGASPQDASRLRTLELQREQLNQELEIQRQKQSAEQREAAAGRGGAGATSAGRVAIANRPAFKAPPSPVPQLASGAAAAAPAGASPARAAGASVAKSQAAAAPASLYFNPQLMTDADGRATVRFVMPQVASEYRLLIDALGQGRIGSRQQIIVCGGPAAAK